jgi:hypothetical protein
MRAQWLLYQVLITSPSAALPSAHPLSRISSENNMFPMQALGSLVIFLYLFILKKVHHSPLIQISNRMASKPGPLTPWPWRKLGNFKVSLSTTTMD